MLKNLNLKYLIKAHTQVGLFTIFFFFISAFFGTITLFLPQIHTWENTSRYFVEEKKHNYKLDKLVKRTIKEEGFNPNLIEIQLPSYRDNVITINDPTSRSKHINPYTLKMLDSTSDTSLLSNFFNDLHIGRNIPKIGQLLMGIASILIIFLTISGVILYLNKHKRNNTEFNFKWHRNLSLLLLPYIIVFSLTGAVLGFMLSSASAFAYVATNTESSELRPLVGPIIFPSEKIPKKSTEFKNFQSIDTLVEKARKSMPNLNVTNIKLLQWNDKNAQIKIEGFLKNNRMLTGRINRVHVLLNPISGELIDKKDLSSSHLANKTLSAFYFFHFIPDETLFVRIIYLILSLAFIASLALGFLIITNKKAIKNKDNRNYFNFTGRFSIAIMFGIIPSSALILVLYWGIPTELFQRTIWIKGIFYSFWAFTLLLSVYYDDILDILKSLALFTSIFLFSAVILHIMATSVYIAKLIKADSIHSVLYFDLTLLLLSIVFFLFYKYSHKITFLTKYSRRYHA